MYISTELEIEALGQKYLGSGIDDAIWFKFKTSEDDITKPFDPEFIDNKSFSDFSLTPSSDLDWWDIEGKTLTGGQVELPNVKILNIGIHKQVDGYIVYCMWHEM